MTDDPRAARILDIVAAETFIDRAKLLPDATINDLGMASLDIVQAIFALESEFDIEIPVAREGGGAEFNTVGELVAHVLATIDRTEAERGRGDPASRIERVAPAVEQKGQ
jgi:acyl carrier protein